MALAALHPSVEDQAAAFSAGLDCATQEAKDPGYWLRPVCAVKATHLVVGAECPEECGGHPICGPCFLEAGWAGVLR